MEYSVAVRTLGTGGKSYQKMLDSLKTQTIRPSAIIVYIADGYPLPKETVGLEQYVYVKKGMVAQRALEYNEVTTEYILFLDDDVYLPPHAVETLYKEMARNHAQVISPCVFANHQTGVKDKIRGTLLGREVCRLWGNRWGNKILRTAGFSYNNHPVKPVYESQSNAGPCFFCRKADFLQIHFAEELWLDKAYYPFPEDQVMFYKMYRSGLKVLTSFDSGIIHMDASTTVKNAEEKTEKLIYSEYRNKLIFWHRFIFLPERNPLLKIWAVAAFSYAYGVQAIKYFIQYLLGSRRMPIAYRKGVADGLSFIRSSVYRNLPKIKVGQ
ncbi:glycosyltransferase [Phocaeicola dorei]|jgi:GT2 family glycosyltransferase|uniref:Glycosyltransferase 2-like domain-containing protein n=1 Tax=Phocaeicola dorei CL02T12C06 TaxID=997876 RepID=I9QRI0_9BACT|nr:glycosyltransferase [Phocaeicola dorei]EIY26947.1 hypothetical protein HMPREF1063_01917 [Phocaeicola dorei CL02T00C15]EIY32276.1 hypothetical protein HMPREF1064_02819 [Phocaeicola dorei CL02T12C06]